MVPERGDVCIQRMQNEPRSAFEDYFVPHEKARKNIHPESVRKINNSKCFASEANAIFAENEILI